MEVTVTHVEAESINDMGDAVLPLSIDGETYNLAKLRLADFADAEAYLKAKAMSALMTSMRDFPMSGEAQGIALALIVKEPYPLSRLIDGQESRLYLLWLSLKRAGNDKGWKWTQDNITVDLMNDLSRVLFWISGVTLPGGDDSENPTTHGDQSEANDGS